MPTNLPSALPHFVTSLAAAPRAVERSEARPARAPAEGSVARVSRLRRRWERTTQFTNPWRSLRWGRDTAVWEAFWRASDPVRYAWWRLKNVRHPIRERATTPGQKRAAQALRREGVVTLPGFLQGDELRAVFTSVRSYVKAKRGVDLDGEVGHRDIYFLNFGNEMTPDDPVMSFLQSHDVVAVASEFLGFHPRLSRIGVFVNEPIEDYGGHDQVQKHWHADTHDFIILKFFVHLTDVGSRQGPFTLVPGTHYFGPHRARFGRMPAHRVGGGISSEEMKTWFPESQWREATGRAGTATFSVTSGLHRGGRVREGRRVMLFAEYGSHHPWVRFDSELPRRRAAELASDR